jgi:hypothetical protein
MLFAMRFAAFACCFGTITAALAAAAAFTAARLAASFCMVRRRSSSLTVWHIYLLVLLLKIAGAFPVDIKFSNRHAAIM